MIDRYLSAVWTRDGMEFPFVNCWGLARIVLKEIGGWAWLPSFDIDSGDKRAMTGLHDGMLNSNLFPCNARANCLAVCWRGRLAVHVAAVIEIDGRLAVIEVDENTGARWQWLKDFEAAWLRVTYYGDKA